MSEVFDIEILRHALVKAVERYDAGVYEGSLEAYAPELLEAFTRLEQAERIADTYQTLYEQRAETLEQAEQAVERVRTLTNELSWSPNHVVIVQRYRNALDGEQS